MLLHELKVAACPFSEIRDFVEGQHYSHSTKGVTPSVCFSVRHGDELVGAAIFGLPAMKETLECYSEGGRWNLLELRRLCYVDETPRNTESFTLAKMFHVLKKSGVERILSYSDPNQGHIGTIYKATGFRFVGQTAAVPIIQRAGVRRTPKTPHDYRRNTRALAKSAAWVRQVKADLEQGKAHLVKEAGKFIYLKDLITKEIA
jgi:hypothetical protein